LPYNQEEEQFFNKQFQLEEQEDRNMCITELTLLEDHTVLFGQSDGPLFNGTSSFGTWSYDGRSFPSSAAFAMKLHRVYNTGSSSTDMGEFTFTVTRVYVGELMHVGGTTLGVEGSIYDIPDDLEDEETGAAADSTLTALLGISSTAKRVGFFCIIDTTPTQDDEDDEDQQTTTVSNDPTRSGTMTSR
jgi:hypothetical protein